MLDGISDIARGVQFCRQGEQGLPLGTMLEELDALCSPLRVRELLDKQQTQAPAQDRCRAARLLRKAHIAARNGNMPRCEEMHRQALEAVGGDEDEVFAIAEEYRFSFVSPRDFTSPQEPRVRHGFAIS
jgi:hypothetical protein